MEAQQLRSPRAAVVMPYETVQGSKLSDGGRGDAVQEGCCHVVCGEVGAPTSAIPNKAPEHPGLLGYCPGCSPVDPSFEQPVARRLLMLECMFSIEEAR